jgi:hypothetical protein
VGVPPGPGASREERLRYIRRCAIVPLPWIALVWIVVLAFGHNSTGLLVVLGVATVLSLGNVASIGWRIRRAPNRHQPNT